MSSLLFCNVGNSKKIKNPQMSRCVQTFDWYCIFFISTLLIQSNMSIVQVFKIWLSSYWTQFFKTFNPYQNNCVLSKSWSPNKLTSPDILDTEIKIFCPRHEIIRQPSQHLTPSGPNLKEVARFWVKVVTLPPFFRERVFIRSSITSSSCVHASLQGNSGRWRKR
jgi:hypothetical protein